jgi:hypothetical protein
MTRQLVQHSLFAAVTVVAGLALAPAAEAQYGEGAGAAPQQNRAAAAQTPRLANGKPDLTGFWRGGGGGGGAQVSGEGNLVVLNRSRGCHPGMAICTAPVNQSNDSTFEGRYDANRPLYKPEHWAKVRELDFNSNKVAPYFKCQPAGLPRMGPPVKILATNDEVVFLYAQQGPSPSDYRIIPTDGRPHDPVKSQDLLYYGHSVGKWEGDTLVIHSVAFNDVTWMGQGGYFHSDQMEVIERFRRDGNTLHYQATVIDPEVLIEPWVMNPVVMRLNTDKNATIAEQNPCEERDFEHMVGAIRH